MKSFIDLSSYSNQSRLSNTGKIIKQTSNNKSLNQTIEKKSKSKEKKIESKNLKKSNLNFNYSNQSKNKSYDLKKIKSNEILNLKINDKKIQKEKKITQSCSNIKQNSNTFLNGKIYERVIDKLFCYMKNILPYEIYNEIKMKFINEITKEISFYNNKSEKKKNNEINSSIINLIKSIKTKKNINNMNSNLKLSYNLKKHSSLYSLTKNLSNRTISNSK